MSRNKGAKNKTPRLDSAAAAKRRLQMVLLVFFAALCLPLYLLISLVQGRLETEVYYEHREGAEELVGRLNQRIGELLEVEDKRSFGDYGFVRVISNALVRQQALSFSPLSQYPPQSLIPGIIGYFQLNPDGGFQTPLLPAVRGGDVDDLGISQDELKKRQALEQRIKALLKGEGGFLRRENIDYLKNGVPPVERSGGSGGKTGFISSVLLPPAYAQVEDSVNPGTERISPERLKKYYNIDESLWNKNADTPSSRKGTFGELEYRGKARQEKVVVPQVPQSLRGIESYFERDRGAADDEQGAASFDAKPQVRNLGRSIESNERVLGKESVEAKQQKQEEVVSPQKTGDVAKKIDGDFVTFISEIEPLQFRILENGVFVFYRRVWKDKQRYLQGFLCDGRRFVEEIVKNTFLASRMASISTLIVANQGEGLWRFQPRPNSWSSFEYADLYSRDVQEKQEILTYRSPLAAPLDSLELLFTTSELPTAPGAFVIYALEFVIGCVLLAGLFGLYFLGLKQIGLAKERSNFVSAVSHELKTPLTSIRMYAEMLRADWVQSAEKKKSYYDFIFFESERLSRLINNVLQLSRLGNSRHSLELKQYSLRELLEFARSKAAVQAEGAGFVLEVSSVGSMTEQFVVRLDEDAMSSIVINLVDNAIKFSSQAEKKVIELGLRVQGEKEVVFYVRDFGPGVSKAQMKKIFRLFYRGQDEMTRSTSGTGIGLALVRELASLMSAEVDLQNRSPGAEFQVRFPLERGSLGEGVCG